MSNELQDKIKSLLNTMVAEEKERGAQVTIYQDGKLIVDAWAGVADVRTGKAVHGDSLFPVFSTTKGIAATLIHVLVERGQLDYDTPIAHYWPEFATNGKEAITLRHALAHTSGIPYMPEGVTREQVSDWEYMCQQMEQMKPAFPAGEKQVYHAVTYGWILGELAKRVDGRDFGPLMEAEICRPLGITAMYCGIPDEVEPEVAFLEITWQEKVPPPPNDIAPSMIPLHEWMNWSGARRTCQPGSSGIMSARAIARHYAALLPGGVDGVELLPPSRVLLATEEQVPSKGYDPASPARKALGYQIGNDIIEFKYDPTAFGHFGYGGSMGFAIPKHRLAVAVTHNRFSEHPFSQGVMREVYAHLGIS